MIRRNPISLAASFLLWFLVPLEGAAETPAEPYRVKLAYDVRMPMRDGVTLSADVYRPDASGRFPVILVRTPYDNGTAGYVARGKHWASRGYVYVVQDVRGRGESEGEFYPLIHEAEDGYDTQSWCGTQPWSSGKVGTAGGSYLGWTQVYPAGMRNPYLVAMISIVTPPDPIRNIPSQYGAYSPVLISWLHLISGKTLQDLSQHDLTKIYSHLPLIEQDTLLGHEIKAWRDWFSHPTLDEYWQKQLYQNELLKAKVPILHMATGALDPEVRDRQRLLIGPWGHDTNAGTTLGDIDFGTAAVIDLDRVKERWFDRWLKGEDNGVDSEPPVRIFVNGREPLAQRERVATRTHEVRPLLSS